MASTSMVTEATSKTVKAQTKKAKPGSKAKAAKAPEQVPLADFISFKGKSAMITGAAAGIGRAIARRFAEAEADLRLVDKDGPGLRGAVEVIGGVPVNVFLHEVDLSTKRAVDELWESIRGEEPDILVNNAGVYPFKDYLQTDEEFLNKVLAREVFKGNAGLIGDSIRYSQRLSIPRMARPDDVARMVLVLASDLACFVNGALIPVDGGFLSA